MITARTQHSIKAMRTAALFGIDLDEHDALAPRHTDRASELAGNIEPGTINHITGPSGAGKTTLLRGLAEQLQSNGCRVIDAQRIRLPDEACVDCFPGDLHDGLQLLANAGLAEAGCFVRNARQLSDGERFRLRLALAMRRANALDPTPAVIIIDEFAATLDRPTAHNVAQLLRRHIGASPNTAAITVTSHDDLDPSLRPDAWWRLTSNSIEQQEPRSRASIRKKIVLEEGTLSDYLAMAHWHYRPGVPAAPVKTLVLRHTGLNEVIGALVVVMPTLNAFWRQLAWPGRFTTGDKPADAKRINREIRRLSRTVIDPRFRGQGLACRLVRAYLRDPITPCTEAAAVMGGFNRFNERAGMTAYHRPPSARQARLHDALRHVGIQPHDLATPAATWSAITETAANARFIERELRSWAGASRSTANHASDDIQSLWRRACRSVAGVPIGYAHTATN